jgi:hypothetical protein
MGGRFMEMARRRARQRRGQDSLRPFGGEGRGVGGRGGEEFEEPGQLHERGGMGRMGKCMGGMGLDCMGQDMGGWMQPFNNGDETMIGMGGAQRGGMQPLATNVDLVDVGYEFLFHADLPSVK